jgi:hypothetical protein
VQFAAKKVGKRGKPCCGVRTTEYVCALRTSQKKKKVKKGMIL